MAKFEGTQIEVIDRGTDRGNNGLLSSTRSRAYSRRLPIPRLERTIAEVVDACALAVQPTYDFLQCRRRALIPGMLGCCPSQLAMHPDCAGHTAVRSKLKVPVEVWP